MLTQTLAILGGVVATLRLMDRPLPPEGGDETFVERDPNAGRRFRPGRGRRRVREGRNPELAADHPEFEGVRPGGKRPYLPHQHQLPRSHRRQDAHRDAGRTDDSSESNEDLRLDGKLLRVLERRCRLGVRPAGARADRQGDLGDADTAWAPSPAALRTTHYRQVDVRPRCGRARRPT